MAEPNDFDLYGDLYEEEEIKSEVTEIKPATISSPLSSTTSSAIPSYNDNNNTNNQQQYQQNAVTSSQATPIPIHYDPGFGGKPAILGTTKPNDMPDEGKMFVGGLNWDTTDEGLKAYFEQFGRITHCTIMKDTETNRSRGFAFLTFESGTSVNAVMAREHYLDGKTIDPKRAIPRTDGTNTGAKTDKLFVRSIPNTCTQESFRTYWRGFGQITDATLMMDKESGRHRGFGFVNYENSEAVEKVLKSGPHVMDGQTLEVKRAQTKTDQQPNNNQNNNFQNRQQNNNYNNNNNNNNNPSYNNNNPTPTYNNNNQLPTPTPGAGFDPATMAKFFQQMGWSNFNPMMMGGPGGPGMQGMPGMGMPGMGMPGMGMPGMGMPGMGMPGMGMPGMPGMGMPGMGMPGMGMPQQQQRVSIPTGPALGEGSEESGIPGSGVSAWTAPMNQQGGGRGGYGGGRGGGSYRGGAARGGGAFGAPTGPASMRGNASGADAEAGPGPTRSTRGGGVGGAGFHPYSR